MMPLPNDIDLLNPPADLEKSKHKLKRLVPSPNSFFMDVKCQACSNITTAFSHSQTVVVCGNCQTVLCQPTGGRARLTKAVLIEEKKRQGGGGRGSHAFLKQNPDASLLSNQPVIHRRKQTPNEEHG